MKTAFRSLAIFTIALFWMGPLHANAQTPQATPSQDDPSAAAHAVFADGFALFQQGTAESLRAAKAKFESAAEMFRRLGDQPWLAASLLALGRIENDLDDKPAAIAHYQEALPLLHDQGQKEGELSALNNIGAAYLALGENQLALKYFEQTLTVAEELADNQQEATVLSNIGSIYSTLGDYQTALKYFQRSLPLIRTTDDRSQEAATLSNIAGAYGASGDKKMALDYYQQALVQIRKVDDKRAEATILNNLAVTHSDLNEHENAVDEYNKVLEIRRTTGDREGEAVGRNNLGTEYLLLGKMELALRNLNQALLLRREVGDLAGEAMTLRNLMGCWHVVGNLRFATFYGKLAIDKYQRMRQNIKCLDVVLQRSYLSTIEDAYRQLASLLAQQGRLAELQQVLNSFKDQQSLDLETAPRNPLTLAFTRHEADLAADHERTLEQIWSVGKKFKEVWQKESTGQTVSSGEKQQLEQEMTLASNTFTAVLTRANVEFAREPDQNDVAEVSDTREMQSALRELSLSTKTKAVAVYTVIDEDEYRALVVTPDNTFAVSTPIKGAELNQKALQLWSLLRTPKYDPQPLAKELYDIVFAPLAAKLPADTKTILWSLDGNLRYLPMAALYDGKQYLVEHYQNVVFTRADKERMTRAMNPVLTGAGFGSSEAHTVELTGQTFTASALPGVKLELGRIFKAGDPRGVLEGEVLLDAGFTKPAMLAELNKHRPLVHIASHFRFEPGDEARSFLLLGDGSPFTLDEMKRLSELFSGVDLLTLSACQTAAQRPDASGREVDGFAELAQRLGAGAVIASLWEVSDTSTAELMARFYRGYRGAAGDDKAEALRRAQLALLDGEYHEEATAAGRQLVQDTGNTIKIEPAKLRLYVPNKKAPFAHPFYWSPFILIGNWK